MSARISLKTHKQTSCNFPYMLPVAVARSSSEIQCNMLCTSGFVDDITFSHNGTKEAESKTTLHYIVYMCICVMYIHCIHIDIAPALYCIL